MKAIAKSHPTLGLAMIMKDEIEDLDRIVNDYEKYFDKIYVTATRKKTFDTVSKSAAGQHIDLSYFKWIDHFGKARNYNLSQVKTDYWMWIDLDDEIEGAEELSQMVEYMDTNGIDKVWFKYEYVRRMSMSEPEVISWRERIIRTASKLKWNDEAVHETVEYKDKSKEEFLPNIVIKHRQTAEHSLISGKRNQRILEKDWQQTHRPMTAFYLGSYFGELGDYESAIEKLSFVAEHGENNILRFSAWQYLSVCYSQTGRHEAALAAINECIAIEPNHPEPWFDKFVIHWTTGDHDSAMRAAEVAMSKRTHGDFAQFINQDPSRWEYKGPFDVARAYLSLGNIERAYQLYSQVKEVAPQYIEEISTVEDQWNTIFEHAYKNRTA